MRLDSYLCAAGMCESRTKAQCNIKAGMVTVNGIVAGKCSYEVSNDDIVEVKEDYLKFVGRGGEKLEGALIHFCVDAAGLKAVDIGASTGGFTDCLLKHGAKHVYAVDCGRDQLHEKLRNDPRVTSLENTNAKFLTEKMTDGKVDIAVMDVSFISQTKLYTAIAGVLKKGGALISLIKPQFEAGPGGVGKNGIVTDERIRKAAVKNVIDAAMQHGFDCIGKVESPIKGGDGNTEYLAYFKYRGREDTL